MNNYVRGNIFRSEPSLKFIYKELYEDDFVGSEAFIVGLLKSEDDNGQIFSELVFLGATSEDILILDGRKIIAKIPFSCVNTFGIQSLPFPYYFPPQIPPRNAAVIELDWTNNDGNTRNLILLFPDLALMAYELEFQSQNVYNKILNGLKKHNKILNNKNPSETLQYFVEELPKMGILNEVNTEPNTIDEYLGA
jgi:hypothetical protein